MDEELERRRQAKRAYNRDRYHRLKGTDKERDRKYKRDSFRRMRDDPERWAAYLAKKNAARKIKEIADPEWAERQRAKSREWRQRNRELVKAYKRADRQRNPEKTRQRMRDYYQRNRQRLLSQEKFRQALNREEILAERRADRERSPEKYKKWRDTFKINNPAAWRLYGIRKTAKAKELQCDLDREWFEVRLAAGACEMSGLPFDNSKRGPNSPSVDRIDPKGPYTKANCRLILWWLNRAMLDLGEDYAIMVFSAILARRGAPQQQAA